MRVKFCISCLCLFLSTCSISLWLNYKDYKSIESAKNGWAASKSLNLSNQNLKELPKALLKLQEINFTSLRADYNQIHEIPDFICKLTPNLRFLYLEYNLFSKLPKIQCKWPNGIGYFEFNHISYKGNRIIALPTSFKFIAARFLDLSYNKIENVPDDIIWGDLFSLNLSYNKIATLPKNFKRNGLYFLNLSHNQLTTLPDRFDVDEEIKDESGKVIRRYRSYKHLLDVSYNKIEKIPEAFLKNNKKTKNLVLTGNPLSEAEVEKVCRALPDTEVVF